MMKPIIYIFIFVLILIGIVYFLKLLDSKGGDSLAGKEKYNTHCLSCHGEKARGDGLLAQSLPNKPSDLQRELSIFYNYDSVLINTIVMNGKIDQGMPAFKNVFNKQDAKDIFAYIRTIN